MHKIIVLASVMLFNISRHSIAQSNVGDSPVAWQKGFMDIHFIHSGRGNASFMVFPDGTSLLFDVGDAKQRDKDPYYPPFADEDKPVSHRVLKYIEFFNPRDSIDYALISHFHNDHYGEVLENTPFSARGDYRLTGITAIGDAIPLKNLIDRAFPDYNFPYDLRKPNGKPDKTLINYLKFIIYHQKNAGMNAAQLKPGSDRQIFLQYDAAAYPSFKVRNVKVNGYFWTGKDDKVGTFPFDPPLVNNKGDYNENPLSMALKVTYGSFDYYVGGDIPGVNNYPDYDMETPMANIVGNVDALTLNHHGYKDATNNGFLAGMKPRVIAHQSLHDPHFAEKVQYNLKQSKADVFSTCMGDSIRKWYGARVSAVYKSTKGHFFIRVYPGGNEFEVFVLNETDNGYELREKFGPYLSE